MFPIRDTIPTLHPAVAVRLLVLANAFVFLFELSLPGPVREAFFELFGIVPARFTHPQWAERIGLPVHDWWPFLTSMFLHAGWLHVIGNMWTLWIFGEQPM
jgi:membrane associated rhomboid family serine protease